MLKMNFHRTFLFSACVIWQLINGGEIKTKIYGNQHKSKSDCITDFKFEEFDSDEKDMIFSWKGRKGYHNGITYNLDCALSRSYYNSYKPFYCSSSESSFLPKQTDKYGYIPDTEYYCTVKTSIFEGNTRSDIIRVSTPGYSFKKPVAIGVSVFCVFFVTFVILGIYWYRRRRIPIIGVVVRESAPGPYPPNVVQNPYNYAQMQNPPYPIAAQPQPCMQQNPLGNPPPYTSTN